MPPRPGTLRNRWTAYAALSTTLAAGVILKALAQRPNFYSAAVYLWQSSANLMILCNLLFVTACTFLLFLQQALYGPLRPIEIEQLYEKAWFAVTETCLAMTIFRGEIGAWFLVMFFSLLAGKVWGWIGEGRVEVVEQQQHNILAGPNARLLHTRLVLSLALSVIFDVCMLDYIVGQVLHMARPDMMVMFGFEFAVLTITSTSTALRYMLNLVEGNIVQGQKRRRMEAIRKERIEAAVRDVQPQPASGDPGQAAPEDEATLAQRRSEAETAAAAQPIDDADVEVEGWEGKGRWTFYLDLTTDFCKLCIYLSFFFILLIFYGLPLHIMRDVFLTCRSFFKRIGDFVRYRNATKDMNERYPDATEADIGREDVCIICREEMRVYVAPEAGAAADPVAERMRPKKLPCGHVLHFSCLRSWLERQQICPTCRATVVPAPQAQQGAARAQGPAGRPQHPQNEGNGRPRVYQFGPLRIGVGAVRGNDLFEQLDQQLANLNAQPADGQNNNGPQQYGFGIRWGGARRRQPGTQRQARGSVEDQLRAAEQQIQREADALQASMGELQALRNVQAQLIRIRMGRNATATQPQPAQVQAAQQQGAQTRVTQPTAMGFRPSQQQNVLQAGSDQLPAGLTLPEGWSMIPLEPVRDPHTQPHGGLPGMGFQMPGMPAGAMFSWPAFHHHGQNPQMATPGDTVSPLNTNPVPGSGTQPPTQLSESRSQQPPPATQQAPAAAVPADFTANMSQHQLNQPAERVQPLSDSLQARMPARPPSQQQPHGQSPARNLPQPSSPTVSHRPPAPQRAPQAVSTTTTTTRTRNPANSVPPTESSNAPSRRQGATASEPVVPPPRQLPPTSGRATSNGGRIPSPHRLSRSIGSSWGFSGVENVDSDEHDEDDEDTTDSDEEKESGKSLPPYTNGTASRSGKSANTSSNQRPRGKGKGATVEDLAEDPV